MAEVNFFYENIDFRIEKKRKIKHWIENILTRERYKREFRVSYIFCSDSFLSVINRQYLHHTSLTDIITFSLADTEDEIEGEVYISIDRVRENSNKFDVLFETELYRVIVHGILHLLGYKDKTGKEKEKMRRLEESYIKMMII